LKSPPLRHLAPLRHRHDGLASFIDSRFGSRRRYPRRDGHIFWWQVETQRESGRDTRNERHVDLLITM
jgi:hypothetical protein